MMWVVDLFNNNLKYCREELEMTQKELGFVFGVSRYTVHGWENGHDMMPLSKLIKFSNLYGYSLDFICGLSKKNIKYGKLNIDKEVFGNNIKRLRKELNLSQQSLAKECGISQTTYSGYETGSYLINTITLYTICQTYGVSMDLLLRGKIKKPN